MISNHTWTLNNAPRALFHSPRHVPLRAYSQPFHSPQALKFHLMVSCSVEHFCIVYWDNQYRCSEEFPSFSSQTWISLLFISNFLFLLHKKQSPLMLPVAPPSKGICSMDSRASVFPFQVPPPLTLTWRRALWARTLWLQIEPNLNAL